MVAESHTLVVYGASPRGDATLRDVLRRGDGRLTVVALAQNEAERARCCEFHSAYWNELMRDMARSDLGRARLAVDDDPSVGLHVIGYRGSGAPDAIAECAARLGAARIVVADARAAGLGRLALRRLRRRSTVPVGDGLDLPTPNEALSAS